jgi:hypothetical protein
MAAGALLVDKFQAEKDNLKMPYQKEAFHEKG